MCSVKKVGIRCRFEAQFTVVDPGFPDVGTPTVKGAPPYDLPNFPKNCMKLKEFGPPEFTVYIWAWTLCSSFVAGDRRNAYFCSALSSHHWQLPFSIEDHCKSRVEQILIEWHESRGLLGVPGMFSMKSSHYRSEGHAMCALHVRLDWTALIAWWIPNLAPGHRLLVNHSLPVHWKSPLTYSNLLVISFPNMKEYRYEKQEELTELNFSGIEIVSSKIIPVLQWRIACLVGMKSFKWWLV